MMMTMDELEELNRQRREMVHCGIDLECAHKLSFPERDREQTAAYYQNYMCKVLGEPIEKRLIREAAEVLRAEQEKQLTESIIKDIGGINMNGERFVMPEDIDKVIIRTKDVREFEGDVKRSEYTPGPFGRVGYSDLTVRTEAPARTGQFGIKNVIFNNPATIVYWDDDTRTIVYCNDNVKLIKKVVDGKEIEVAKPMKAETYSEEVGLAMAIAKKHYGNSGAYNNIFRKYIPGMKDREKAAKKARKAAKRGGEE